MFHSLFSSLSLSPSRTVYMWIRFLSSHEHIKQRERPQTERNRKQKLARSRGRLQHVPSKQKNFDNTTTPYHSPSRASHCTDSYRNVPQQANGHVRALAPVRAHVQFHVMDRQKNRDFDFIRKKRRVGGDGAGGSGVSQLPTDVSTMALWNI